MSGDVFSVSNDTFLVFRDEISVWRTCTEILKKNGRMERLYLIKFIIEESSY